MPLPFILGAGAAIAGVAGVGSGVHGALKMKEANDTMKTSDSRHKRNIERFEKQSTSTSKKMDSLGQLELNILSEFDEFSNTIEKIQNRPQFKQYNKDGVILPKYDKEALKNVSVGAGVLIGGLGGATLGTAGGFAAAGATTSAVMALGTASTGTAIASLSGAAATNATLAALGGGAIAAGGGGIALGTTILGATTLGVGLLVGGVIFNVTGGKLSDKADEAYSQMLRAEKTINKSCNYLKDLDIIATKYIQSLNAVQEKYLENYHYISYVINKLQKVDWNEFSEQEKIATQNTVLLVGLLYKMCQVNLVNKAENKDEINTINKAAVEESMNNAKIILQENDLHKCSESDLDWQKVKEIILSNMPEVEYYRWIDFLEIQASRDQVKIVAPYKAAAEYVKANYRNIIEAAITMHLNSKITISFGYIETDGCNAPTA